MEIEVPTQTAWKGAYKLKSHIQSLVLVLLFGIFAFFTPAQAQSTSDSGHFGFDVQKLADGIYALIRKEPQGFTTNANTVVIVNDNDVFVVDTTLTPSSAKETLAAIRTLTNKPVRYVINTHWHDDHIMGNQVYRDSFPGIDFIAHEKTRQYLPKDGLKNRQQAMAADGYPQFIAELRSRLSKNESYLGGPLDAEERQTLTSDLGIAQAYMSENKDVEVVLPTITVEDKLRFYRGNRIIDILYLGRGHTNGDIVVHLPQEGIVIAGDLVMAPIPYIGGDQSHVSDWGATLENLLALLPAIIVPGHGPVERDDSHVRLLIELFSSIKRQTEMAIAQGFTLEQTRKSVHLSDFQTRMAGDSKMRKQLFLNYVVGPGIESAYNDAREKK